MSLIPALQAALELPSFIFYVAAEIDLPFTTLYLLDGSASLEVNGHPYVGSDPTYGVITFPESHTDGFEQEAPRMRITLSPTTDAAAAQLIAQDVQGSEVTIRWGAVDEASGISVGSVIVFQGEIDTATLNVGLNTRSIEFDLCTHWDRLLEADDGSRLNNAWQTSVWPGDQGLQYITRLDQKIPWGAANVGAGGANYGGGGTGGGGSGGGGILGNLP